MAARRRVRIRLGVNSKADAEITRSCLRTCGRARTISIFKQLDILHDGTRSNAPSPLIALREKERWLDTIPFPNEVGR